MQMFLKSYTPSGKLRVGERRLGPGTHTEVLMEEVQSSWGWQEKHKISWPSQQFA